MTSTRLPPRLLNSGKTVMLMKKGSGVVRVRVCMTYRLRTDDNKARGFALQPWVGDLQNGDVYERDDGEHPVGEVVGTLTGRTCGTSEDPCQMMEMAIDEDKNVLTNTWHVLQLNIEPVVRIMLGEETRDLCKAVGGFSVALGGFPGYTLKASSTGTGFLVVGGENTVFTDEHRGLPVTVRSSPVSTGWFSSSSELPDRRSCRGAFPPSRRASV